MDHVDLFILLAMAGILWVAVVYHDTKIKELEQRILHLELQRLP